MEFSDPTIIKLKTGEDIIASIKGMTKTRMILENPFTLETLTLIDQNGIPRDERILMKKWVNWVKDPVISLPKAQVLDCMAPSDQAVAHYLMVLKNGGIFRYTPQEQEEMKKNQDFVDEIIEELQGESIMGPDMLSDLEPDREQLPDTDTFSSNNDSTDDFGNRPNDWSPDPRDYL